MSETRQKFKNTQTNDGMSAESVCGYPMGHKILNVCICVAMSLRSDKRLWLDQWSSGCCPFFPQHDNVICAANVREITRLQYSLEESFSTAPRRPMGGE